LYNWYTVNTGKICPSGWHVPTRDEWIGLTEYLGGDSIAGSKLKEAGNDHWAKYNEDATNESGFTGLPGGVRNYWGEYSGNSGIGGWWSATQRDLINAWHVELWSNSKDIKFYFDDKCSGYSVRCVKDK
jgi:uncharacterized protein (TIGR02145 family)